MIWEVQGSERQHQGCMKKTKENWIEEQCSETEETLRKNNSKTRERLDHCETRKSYFYPRTFRRMLFRRTRDTEPVDRILLWAVQSQGQWRSISTELSPDRYRGWPPHPSQRSGGAVQSLKKGRLSGADNIPAELVITLCEQYSAIIACLNNQLTRVLYAISRIFFSLFFFFTKLTDKNLNYWKLLL